MLHLLTQFHHLENHWVVLLVEINLIDWSAYKIFCYQKKPIWKCHFLHILNWGLRIKVSRSTPHCVIPIKQLKSRCEPAMTLSEGFLESEFQSKKVGSSGFFSHSLLLETRSNKKAGMVSTWFPAAVKTVEHLNREHHFCKFKLTKAICSCIIFQWAFISPGLLGATVAHLTPDQKAVGSNPAGVTFNSIFGCIQFHSMQDLTTFIISFCGWMVQYLVAIEVARVRFPAEAFQSLWHIVYNPRHILHEYFPAEEDIVAFV